VPEAQRLIAGRPHKNFGVHCNLYINDESVGYCHKVSYNARKDLSFSFTCLWVGGIIENGNIVTKRAALLFEDVIPVDQGEGLNEDNDLVLGKGASKGTKLHAVLEIQEYRELASVPSVTGMNQFTQKKKNLVDASQKFFERPSVSVGKGEFLGLVTRKLPSTTTARYFNRTVSSPVYCHSSEIVDVLRLRYNELHGVTVEDKQSVKKEEVGGGHLKRERDGERDDDLAVVLKKKRVVIDLTI
jgi:hypothetical protein